QTEVPEGLKNPKIVSSGSDHTCAIDDDGVKCWGVNYSGGTNVPSALKNPKIVSSGGSHTCAIYDEGVKCWGSNEYGQTEVPEGLKNPKIVSSGRDHTCAIDDEGVKCWGYNPNGQTDVPEFLHCPWYTFADILSQFTMGDKFQFLTHVHDIIEVTLDASAPVKSPEHQILALLMSRYVTEFPTDYFKNKIVPIWQRDLDRLVERTGIKSAKDVPVTPQTLQIAVKLLNSAFIAVKPMLGSSEQHEVEDITLAINETLAGAMTHESAKALVAKIKSHDKLLKAITDSDAVHMTSVVVEDVTAWITEQ
ncbi:MAG: RCC1 domain-containing protein, partial [Pseudomonadota bacterium]